MFGLSLRIKIKMEYVPLGWDIKDDLILFVIFYAIFSLTKYYIIILVAAPSIMVTYSHLVIS